VGQEESTYNNNTFVDEEEDTEMVLRRNYYTDILNGNLDKEDD